MATTRSLRRAGICHNLSHFWTHEVTQPEQWVPVPRWRHVFGQMLMRRCNQPPCWSIGKVHRQSVNNPMGLQRVRSDAHFFLSR